MQGVREGAGAPRKAVLSEGGGGWRETVTRGKEEEEKGRRWKSKEGKEEEVRWRWRG